MLSICNHNKEDGEKYIKHRRIFLGLGCVRGNRSGAEWGLVRCVMCAYGDVGFLNGACLFYQHPK